MSFLFNQFNQAKDILAQQAHGLFNKKPEDEDKQRDFQDLLSRLQPKQPGSIPTINSNMPKSGSHIPDQVTSAELKMNEDIIEDQAEAGWGINDDDLILDEPENVVEPKKEVQQVEKKGIDELKKSIEIEKKEQESAKKSSWADDLAAKHEQDKPHNKDQGQGKSQDSGSLRKFSKDLKEKATGIATGVARNVATGITNVPGKFLGKVTPKSSKDDLDAKSTEKTSDFRKMFDVFSEDPAAPPHHGKESHGDKEEKSIPYKEQLQRYMAQAHQLEMLIKVEQEMLRDEYNSKLKDLESLQEEATMRLETCQSKERDLRTLDEKIKLKESLSVDEAHLDKVAKEIQDAQEKISNLEDKNQFLELSLKNEQEKLQKEMHEKIEALRNEHTTHLNSRETHLRNEHDRNLEERVRYHENEMAKEKNRYKEIVEKIKKWNTSFQEYKKHIRGTLQEIEEILWARGEEFQSSTDIIHEFQEKVVQLGRNYRVKVEQKDQKIAQYQESEKHLREEMAAAQREKNQVLNAKEKEIKELKSQYQKLEKTHATEKEYLSKAMAKTEEVTEKVRETEEKLKVSEKEKNELKKNLENEKRNSANLQERIDELSQKGKDTEGTTRTLEKTNNEIKKALEIEKKKVLELQTELDSVLMQDKENDSRLIALEKKNREWEEMLEKERNKSRELQAQIDALSAQNSEKSKRVEALQEEWEEIVEKEKSKSLALQLKLDEAKEAEKNKETEITKLEREKKELEDKHLDEIKALKEENYNMENSYMKEIEEYTKEINDLKASQGTEKPSQKSNSNEVKELTKMVEMMNKEKIQLMEKYKKEKSELMASNDERFNSVNVYIQELYGKNHELSEENKTLIEKLNKFKEKLSVLASNFKNLGGHTSSGSSKELRQLLAHFNLLSGPSSEAAPDTPSRDDLREDLHEDLTHKAEELISEKAEPKSSSSPQRKEAPAVISRETSPTKEEKKKRGSMPLTVELPQSERAKSSKEKAGSNLLAQRSPTVKDLPPHSAKAELQKFSSEAQEEQGGSVNDEQALKNASAKSKRPKSAHERVPSFSDIDSPTGTEPAIGILPSGSKNALSQENTPRDQGTSRTETGITPNYEPDSPKFEGPASPRFESKEVRPRKSTENAAKHISPKFEDFESPTFEGKKLGDYVKAQNDSFSNLDEKGGNDGWDVDLDVQDQGEQGESSPTFEPGFGKPNEVESPTFKVSNAGNQKPSRLQGQMEEVKMLSSPRLRNRSPSFSNNGDEDKKEKDRELEGSYGAPKFPKKENKSQPNSANVSKGLIEMESPKFKGSEEPVNEPRFGGNAENLTHSQGGWATDVDLTGDVGVAPRFGGSAENIVPEQKGWAFDDMDANVSHSPELGSAVEKKVSNKSRNQSEKASATRVTQGEGWGFDVDNLSGPGTPGLQAQAKLSPTKNQTQEEPLEVEGGWAVDEPVVNKSPVKTSPALQSKGVSDPLIMSPGVEGGWDVGIDVSAGGSQQSRQSPTKHKSPTKVSEPRSSGINAVKDASEPFSAGGGWDVGIDVSAGGSQQSRQSPTKLKSPTKVSEPRSSGINAVKDASEPFSAGGGWDVGVDLDAGSQHSRQSPVKQKSPTKTIEPKSSDMKAVKDVSDPISTGGGWDVGLDLDAGEDLKQPGVPEPDVNLKSNSSTKATPAEKNLLRSSESQLKVEKENKTETTPLKSAGKVGPVLNFGDSSGKKLTIGKTEVAKGLSDEKKEPVKPEKKTFVINKALLSNKAGTTGGNKLSLGKPKDEDKGDIDLEKFLGSSLK